jgi:hypothetical protein
MKDTVQRLNVDYALSLARKEITNKIGETIHDQ